MEHFRRFCLPVAMPCPHVLLLVPVQLATSPADPVENIPTDANEQPGQDRHEQKDNKNRSDNKQCWANHYTPGLRMASQDDRQNNPQALDNNRQKECGSKRRQRKNVDKRHKCKKRHR